MSRVRLSAVLFASVLVACLAAQTASAAPTWHNGSVASTTISDCYTASVVSGVGYQPSLYYDDGAPPKVGDVFYIGVNFAGIDDSCAESGLPWLQLPPGLQFAVSAQNPIYCFTDNIATKASTPNTTQCPTAVGNPLFGGSGVIGDKTQTSPGLWDLHDAAYEVHVPVAATTPGPKTIGANLHVISGSPVSTPGDLEQSLSINIGGNANPADVLSGVSAPKKLKSKALLKSGTKVEFTIGQTSDVKVVLQVKSGRRYKTVAACAGKQIAAGPVTCPIKPAKKMKKYFRKKVAGRFQITVTPSGQAGVSSTKSVSIRP